MTEPQDAEAVRASDRAHGQGLDEDLYFGPCLNPGGEPDPVKSLMSGFARSRQHVNGDTAWFAKQVRGTAPEPPPDEFPVPPGFAEDLRNALMDAYGLPRDLFTRELPPPTWRTRWLSRWNELREQTARRDVRGGRIAP